MVLIKAEANNLRISPRKIRLVAKSLRGQKASDVLAALRFIQKGVKTPLLKVIKSAVSNATNNAKLDEKDLFIKEIITMDGTKLKRFRPRSRGMSHSIFKRTANVRVILEDRR